MLRLTPHHLLYQYVVRHPNHLKNEISDTISSISPDFTSIWAN
ncbi:hypothetical protein POKO110462_22420 [Pontibacter korlensis]